MNLDCVHRYEPDAVRLVVRGELDVATAPSLRAALVTPSHDGRPVRVDLSDVGFMDASGLRVLLEAQADARRHGQSFVMVGRPSRAVARVLEASRTVSAFEWQPA